MAVQSSDKLRKEGQMEESISMVHGSGGQATGELIHEVFAKEFDSHTLNLMEDSAVVAGNSRIAVTTDSFVVTPVEFRGGDLGRLCVCGTVNDLLMRGATPKYLTCGAILEEGASIETLRRIIHSMAETAREAGVEIIAGDTKVIEGNGGIYINTTGIGFVPSSLDISAQNAKAGDVILVSGTMGDHHAAILSQRMNIDTDIESDNAPLNEMVLNLLAAGIQVRTLRDITRGGLATVLKELAEASKTEFVIEESRIPVTPKVRDFAAMLGLDPIYMGNEGKLTAIVAPEDEAAALAIMRNCHYGHHACRIGQVVAGEAGRLVMQTDIGGRRILDILQGEGLPRIC